MKKIALLGSTGSIGTQTLEVVRTHPDRFAVVALAAGNNLALVIEQARQFRPAVVSVATKALAEEARIHMPSGTRIVYGEQGLIEAATMPEADIVVTAVMGSRGLPATLAALEAGKTIGLANKETLVAGGELVTSLARRKGVSILPVDSEHSAIFQCLNGERKSAISKITLTASGGSFRDRSREELEGVTVAEALSHPNWSMGAKITIDSATMVNKGLEVIEAKWLFDIAYDQIEVLLHPESIIHSFVEFVDRSVIAQLGMPDMRVPIQYALSYPERLPNTTQPLDLAAVGKLHFRAMDYNRYPCLALAFQSGRQGKSMPVVYNAANEVAVERFLKGGISFLDIERIVERTVELHQPFELTDVNAIIEADQWARKTAFER